jgi:hypothetical protein
MRDIFPELFVVGPDGERLNGGPVQPVGTLARETFRVSRLKGREILGTGSGGGFPLQLARRLFVTNLSPQKDLARLLGASPHWSILARRGGRERAQSGGARAQQPGSSLYRSRLRYAKRCLRELPAVREAAEFLAGLPPQRRLRLLAQAFTVLPSAAPARSGAARYLRRVGRLARRTVRWVGLVGDGEAFAATPAGAVLLSALFGVYRGGLGVCQRCGSFALYPKGRWRTRDCDACRSSRAPWVKGAKRRWQKVLWRMRKRGFKRMGLVTKEAQDLWRRTAMQRLMEVRDPEGLDAWENTVAPRGKPGRPRKNQVTTTPGR